MKEETLNSWPPRRLQTTAEADIHPDPLVESVRYQICEAELIQAIGRARAIRRTATTPVELLILTAVPLPLAVDQATTWSELVPDRFQVMAARGVVPGNADDMAQAYPDLFPTADAATVAIKRSPTSP